MANNYKYWKLKTDRDNIVWLAFDKQGALANILSDDLMAEFDRILDELRSQNPRGHLLS